MTETQKKSLDDLVREELGAEPSQEAKDYARLLYERYRLPEPSGPEREEDVTAPTSE
ncbi:MULTISPECIES: hypothetical protein [Nocardiopsis]|uniref:Uncharacterized protein n=1 Tax=Nocardiopsis lambiniae TaxID=3075539 RepID=A0ABU2M4N8_9ACTN|nr:MULTISPECIES: hypothetical protein [unclassified Nocardiopsis]MDE3719878.1 hypothetical protein [Nocardiopsis sp. N85]MDT0327608.1 hypothetical protein [Nocardiopsis sp. DSM 44743]